MIARPHKAMLCVQDGAGPLGGGDPGPEESPAAGWVSHHLWLRGAETQHRECRVSLPDAWLHHPTAGGQRYVALLTQTVQTVFAAHNISVTLLCFCL